MNNKPNNITKRTTKFTSKMAGILIVVSTTLVILFVGIPCNMNIAYAAGDDPGTSIIDVSSAQGFKEIQNCGTSADGIAIWCV
ncbi:MAG TPA: hypothetical protein VFU79_04000 [Nitrososphaeraceae archaeon]|nr:hypothetical protein [Nitrososphaeraceae archaeon]